MFWFDKANPATLFCDNREFSGELCDGRKFEVKPDMVCDFAALPFDDASFYHVVFDPPHLTRNTGNSKMAAIYGSLSEKAAPNGYQMIKYGELYSDWKDMLTKGFSECFRVLKPFGTLVFKWSDIDIKVSEVLALSPIKPLYGHRSGKRSKTHWICFMKLPQGGDWTWLH
ncbi:methyltransferase [Clostridia bacterium]|nr:methyltransferase [Clostridia bacterium]